MCGRYPAHVLPADFLMIGDDVKAMQHAADGLDRCLEGRGGAVHLLGICGVGMAGLAALLQGRGLRVSGCDASANPLRDWLLARGIPVAAGHDPAHLASEAPMALIRSAAVPESDPELVAARALGLPVHRRGEVLPRLLAGRTSVAVGGTHGKTTTSGFVAQMLLACGRAPAWCIGGEIAALDGVAGDGGGAEIVVEADESDGTLALYHPTVAVVTGIEFDHMEHFGSPEALEACYAQFIAQAGRAVVYCREDARARALCEGRAGAVSYGFDPACIYRACNLKLAAEASTCDVTIRGEAIGSLSLPVPGRHNILNALGALAACHALGIGPAEGLVALGRVGLARRRLDRIVSDRGITVVSDYAHHPTEIRALLDTVQLWPHQRRLGVFQPHRYTRTLALGEAFTHAFDGLDRLLLAPVYAASEAALPGGGSWDLYARFRAAGAGGDGDGRLVPALVGSLEEAWGYLRGALRKEDLLLLIGAGDIESLGVWAQRDLAAARVEPEVMAAELRRLLVSPETRVRVGEPLADKTTLGVGGAADLWVELGDERDASCLLAWTTRQGVPLTLLGGGSNVLVSDLGVRGVVARLSGAAFRQIRVEGDCVIAGAGLPLSELVDWFEREGVGGYEYLEGIPGMVGGAMHMNAGAWGHNLGERVVWIRSLNSSGQFRMVAKSGLELSYRRCGHLASNYYIEGAYRLTPGDRGTIRRQREAIRARRAWMSGHRSAGSGFKNPPGDKAGRLLQAVGMNGRRIGGAQVYPGHANFITTVDGASASDVRALMETGRAAVEAAAGIRLASEVKVLW